MSKSHNITQGSPSWHAFRAEHFGASEASAMLGLSPYKTRDELLSEKKTGLTKEVNAATQRVFNKGHEVEALARTIVEKMIGEELSPMTFSNGKLSASSDGISFMGGIAWENKQFNKAHFEQVKNGELPEIHWPQCQQVLFCSGAKKLFFTISDGTEENTVGVWVHDDPELQSIIVNGWAQFEKDLANYVPHETVEMPKAAAIMALPALSIAIKGEVTLSNLPEFKEAATAYIAQINTTLVTDDDFSNAEAAAKFCKDAEDNIELTKKSAIAQTASIDELMRTLDFIRGQLRDKRLIIEKLVSSEKESRKLAIIREAADLRLAHINLLDKEIEPINLLLPMADFAGAIKGKKTLSSMQSAVNDELARAKIEADAIALDIRTKLVWFKAVLNKEGDWFNSLYPDLQTIIYKQTDDFQLAVTSRIEAQKKLEAERVAKAKQEEAYKPDLTLDEVMANASPASVNATVGGEFVLTKAITREKPNEMLPQIRPSVNDIVTCVSNHFMVSPMVAQGWLIDSDFGQKIAA